jgi:hypothetical protein
MFAGWITFSAYKEDGCTVAQIELLVRANDPVYELCFRLGASRSENKFWQYTLAAMEAHFGVLEPVQTHVVCIDPSVQWSQFWNIWQNAAIRTILLAQRRTYHARRQFAPYYQPAREVGGDFYDFLAFCWWAPGPCYP